MFHIQQLHFSMQAHEESLVHALAGPGQRAGGPAWGWLRPQRGSRPRRQQHCGRARAAVLSGSEAASGHHGYLQVCLLLPS